MGLVEGNEISGHSIAGIIVHDAGSPQVHFLVDSIQLILKSPVPHKKCDPTAGCSIPKPRPLFQVRDNSILDGLGKGVDVYEGGSGLFHRNEISGNEMDGVVVRTRANPTFTASKVRRVYVLLALRKLERCL